MGVRRLREFLDARLTVAFHPAIDGYHCWGNDRVLSDLLVGFERVTLLGFALHMATCTPRIEYRLHLRTGFVRREILIGERFGLHFVGKRVRIGIVGGFAVGGRCVQPRNDCVPIAVTFGVELGFFFDVRIAIPAAILVKERRRHASVAVPWSAFDWPHNELFQLAGRLLGWCIRVDFLLAREDLDDIANRWHRFAVAARMLQVQLHQRGKVAEADRDQEPANDQLRRDRQIAQRKRSWWRGGIHGRHSDADGKPRQKPSETEAG